MGEGNGGLSYPCFPGRCLKRHVNRNRQPTHEANMITIILTAFARIVERVPSFVLSPYDGAPTAHRSLS